MRRARLAAAASRLLRSPLAPALVAAALVAVYLLWEPRTVDLAAARYRSELFGREGLTIWNGGWYGGHHVLAYSVLGPPLGWLLGPPLAIALATVASAVLFERSAREHFGAERARWGALWFGAAAATEAFTNRLPFALGVALALGAVLALQHRRRGAGALLAALCALASPVAALFLALAGAAAAIAGRARTRHDGLLLAGAALVPAAVLALAFPEGGHALFPLSIYAPIPLFCLAAFLVLPAQERVLRAAVALYAALATVAVLVHTPLGSNAARLGALLGGPLLLCALGARAARAPIAVGLVALGVWQWSTPARDVSLALRDPAAREGYFQPLRERLAAAPGPGRVEVLFTRSHWESREIPFTRPLARGWVRQLDAKLNPLFYEGWLEAGEYRRWLAENAVGWVAVPRAEPDFSSRKERALVDGGLPYLALRWRSRDWRLYEVRGPGPLVVSEGGADIALAGLGNDVLRLRVRTPGSALVRVRWSRYWRVSGGCVEPAGGWTRVRAREAGPLRMTMRVTLGRMVSGGRRCAGPVGR